MPQPRIRDLSIPHQGEQPPAAFALAIKALFDVQRKEREKPFGTAHGARHSERGFRRFAVFEPGLNAELADEHKVSREEGGSGR